MSGYPDYVGSWTVESALQDVENTDARVALERDRLTAAEDRLLDVLGWKFSELTHGAKAYDHPRLPAASGLSRAMALRHAIDAARMVLRQPKAPPEPRPAEINENLISCQEAD